MLGPKPCKYQHTMNVYDLWVLDNKHYFVGCMHRLLWYYIYFFLTVLKHQMRLLIYKYVFINHDPLYHGQFLTLKRNW